MNGRALKLPEPKSLLIGSTVKLFVQFLQLGLSYSDVMGFYAF
jgi:hypothetical protein